MSLHSPSTMWGSGWVGGGKERVKDWTAPCMGKGGIWDIFQKKLQKMVTICQEKYIIIYKNIFFYE